MSRPVKRLHEEARLAPIEEEAYDAANVAREFYSSEQNSARDSVGLTLRFTIPAVVNGRVYVGAKHKVDVYGLLPAQSN